MLLLNQSTVIKPLNIRELDFYQNIPSDIQMFVPNYKGKRNIQICLIIFSYQILVVVRAAMAFYNKKKKLKVNK